MTDTVLDHWTAFHAAPGSFSDEPGIARVVPVLDLLDDVVDLTPARQVRALPVDIDPVQVAQRAGHYRKQLTEQASLLTPHTQAIRHGSQHAPMAHGALPLAPATGNRHSPVAPTPWIRFRGPQRELLGP
ncbi:hypothetical protein ABT134_08590 [Streptomyces hirsutus]